MNIHLRYYKGIIPGEVIDSVSKDLAGNKIHFTPNDLSGVPMMCLDQIISQITLVLSHGIVNSIALGLASNAIYDSIKRSITTISNALEGKTYTKYYHGSGNTKEIPATFGITFKKENGYFDLQFPPDLNDDLKSKCIDKAFEEIAKNDKPDDKESLDGSHYGRYNASTNAWEFIDFRKEVEKLKNQQR